MHDTRSLIENYYEAFNRGEWEAVVGLLDDSVVHRFNRGSRERGLEAFRALLVQMDRCYAEQLRNVVSTSCSHGARAAVEYAVHRCYKVAEEGLPPAHGQNHAMPFGAFFDSREGRITSMTNDCKLRDWLVEVGA
ncbi:MAG: nuclear transport factor 2 family protein [Dokdonella sp.]